MVTGKSPRPRKGLAVLDVTRCFTPCALIALIVLAGCSMTSQGTQSNPGNKMSRVAEELRIQAPIPQALPTELEKQMLPQYVVEPGDVLRAEMVDLDSPIRLPADQPVQIDGKIDLGAYGRIFVAGMTLENAEKLVHSLIKAKTRDAGDVRLRLLTAESKTYFVLGEVNAPGEFTMNGRESVLNAIVRAGGLTSNADVAKILVSRPTKPCDCRKVMPVCYRNIVQIGDTSTNYQIQPGDRVFIPKRPWSQAVAEFFGCKKDCDPCDLPQNGCPAPPLDCTNCRNPAVALPPGSPATTSSTGTEYPLLLPRFVENRSRVN
jgi:polysaccharide export outer membrane protein